MKTLHENIHSDMWFVFKMVSDCLDAVESDEALGAAIRPLVQKINTSVVEFATRDKRVDAHPVDAMTGIRVGPRVLPGRTGQNGDRSRVRSS